MKQQFIITIRAEERLGLMARLLPVFYRRRVATESISASQTDIHGVVVICIVVQMKEDEVQPLILQIGKIIEVDRVEAVKAAGSRTQQVALFRLSSAIMDTPQKTVIEQNALQLLAVYPGALLMSKSADADRIMAIYRQLEGPYLLGFIKSGLITETSLMEDGEERVMRYSFDNDDEARISQLAA